MQPFTGERAPGPDGRRLKPVRRQSLILQFRELPGLVRARDEHHLCVFHE